MDAGSIIWLTKNIDIVNIFATTFVGVITIFAIFRAPITALRIQKKIEDAKNQEQIKLEIFKTLLATRANIISSEHVKALNMIDIEFYKEDKIREAWNLYRDHLNTTTPNPTKDDETRWEENRITYFTELLYTMSQYFGYNFDKVILKKGAYSPQAHGILNLEQAAIRQGFVEILRGNKAIKVELANSQNNND